MQSTFLVAMQSTLLVAMHTHHSHGQIQQRHGGTAAGIRGHDGLVALDARVMVHVTRLRHAHNRMNQNSDKNRCYWCDWRCLDVIGMNPDNFSIENNKKYTLLLRFWQPKLSIHDAHDALQKRMKMPSFIKLNFFSFFTWISCLKTDHFFPSFFSENGT